MCGALSRPLRGFLMAAVVALTVAACGSDDSAEAGGSGAGGESAATSTPAPEIPKLKEPKKVALVTCEPNVFCHAYNINLTRHLEAAGATVTQLSDNFDPALQNQHMNQAIAQKPDVIVLFASNADAVVAALQRAKDAGIPVVNVNARLNPAGDQVITFEVIADNSALGRFAAENLVEGMKKAGYKAMSSSHSAASIASIGEAGAIPALLTTMSRRPWVSSVRSRSSATPATSARCSW
jgi:ABC-type sugar transport system substrate-binding protein